MVTLPGWLLHGDLPPAGNPVSLSAGASAPVFTGYEAYWLNSGTAALALAILTARQRRPDVAEPRVILPAYGCPDLVAAAQYAGARATLVDIGASDPGYSLPALRAALTTEVVAVVAVNFLGVRERLSEIRAMLPEGTLLIEDDAQWFPEPLDGRGLEGDLVCISFGRGKPVSLLGGGALLARSSLEVPAASILPPEVPGLFPAKVRLFNALLRRRLFPIANRNPLLELGRTVFKPLAGIRALDPTRTSLIATNVDKYLRNDLATQSRWSAAVVDATKVGSLDVHADRVGRLLRYPVLCRSADDRQTLLESLRRAGLGATAMYRSWLPDVEGVTGRFDLSGPCPGAQSFASRLLTLPINQQVTTQDIQRAMRRM
jgi:dTDP-4-amino-4,6-dideoxygalactose transaminase